MLYSPDSYRDELRSLLNYCRRIACLNSGCKNRGIVLCEQRFFVKNIPTCCFEILAGARDSQQEMIKKVARLLKKFRVAKTAFCGLGSV
jgi:hypothetical protein